MKDKYKLQKDWQKENMKQVKASYKKDFVLEFREALEKLNLKQSDVLRQAMHDIIEESKKA